MLEIWKVICYLAELCRENEISYQFDGSTAVFIHGIEFAMDDLDVFICADSKEKILALLINYESTEMKIYGNMEYCYIKINGVLVHAMFVHSETNFEEETRDIMHDGIKIHTKTIEFYRDNTSQDNPLLPLIDEWLAVNHA